MPLIAFAPALFVVIWSSGWIVARYAAPYADPLTFLSARYVIAGLLVAAFALAAGATWPRRRMECVHAAVTGVLLHALYLGGVWWAVAHGLPAGVSALIAAIQPLITAALAPALLGERLRLSQILGIIIGFAGVLGVLAPKLAGTGAGALPGIGTAILVNVVAMISVTAGTFYQKRFVASGDLRAITALQYAAAACVTLPVAALTEPMRLPIIPETIGAMIWSVLVLSIGAIGLMLMMIRRGAVSKVAALIYLIPPTAALQAWAMFGETLAPLQVAAMAVAAFGVYLATRAAGPAPAAA